MNYHVTVGGREYLVAIDGEDVTIDGQSMTAHLSTVPGTPLRHLLLGDRSFTLPFESRGSGRWIMAFQGEVWDAEVVDERTRHIRSLTGPGETRNAGGVLRAPMPGLVIRIDVVPGQRLEAGASVVVLEAMKMQNELRAAVAGVVVTVGVKPGQAVEKGQELVVLAPTK